MRINRRFLAVTAIGLALGGCARPPQGSISVRFDQPMVPEDVGRTLLRCGIHSDIIDAPSPEIWQIPPDISRKQFECLKRQPHVARVLPAE